MSSSDLRVTLSLLLLLHLGSVSGTPRALSVTPSSSWYGNDGTWSGVSLRVGTPRQWVDVLVSTASSETWVVSPYGCDGTNKCTGERGGLYNLNKSSTWVKEGFYELGLDTQLGFNGSGDYGLDTLDFGVSGASLNESIISSINTTEYLTGFFGLGIVPGNFSDGQFKSPIGALVESADLIPSHSYGFTAGAPYQQKSEPCSLTLGGYDANRFLPHNVTFELNPIQQPEAFLNSIVVSSSMTKSNWPSSSLQLLAPTNGIYAVIDSSTPFLWLPKSICEQFAEALGLTYNQTLQLYTFDGNSSRHDDLRTWNMNFTFSFSDTSGPDNIVNITLPYAAFDLQLTYPYIPNTTLQSPDSSKYYFPLRQAASDNQYTIGRAFLQETYIITDYDRNNFSIHQAVHIPDPIGNTSIVDITRPSDSKLEGPPVERQPLQQHGLSKKLIISIAIGVSLGTTLMILLAFLYYRCYRRKHDSGSTSNGKAELPSIKPPRHSILQRFSRLHEAGGKPIIFTEMDSSSTQRFELPDSQVAVELESEPSTYVGTQESLNMTAYERARRKNEELLRRREKCEVDLSFEGHHRPYEATLPSPATSNGTTITANTGYSPVSPPPPTYSQHSQCTSGYSTSEYIGRLPLSVQTPKIIGPDGSTLRADGDTIDSLGSGFTEEEGLRLGINEMLDLWGGRRDGRREEVAPRMRDEFEIVHVPVVSEQRFSWEGPNEENGTVISRGTVRYI